MGNECEKVRISVCVITRNQEQFIRQCLESVLEQRGDWDLEVLVGDDCSEDRTGSIIESIARENPGRVMYICHPSNIGAVANMQLLISRACGQFIARLDADDYWPPGKLYGSGALSF